MKSPARVPVRLLFAVWIVAAFILVNLYSSSFYSHLTIPSLEPTIDTLYDLRRAADSDSHRIITMKDSSYYSAFMGAPQEHTLFHAIGRHINRTGESMFSDEREEFERIDADRKVVAIASLAYLKNRFTKTKVYHVGESLDNLFTGIVLPKKSPLLEAFSRV